MHTESARPEIAWRDLIAPTRRQALREPLLPLPWLLAGLGIAHAGWWPAALPFSFLFFLTGLRVAHNGFHRALGLPRAATAALLGVLSVAMLGAMHAVRHNHLRHHQHCLKPGDVEGDCARGSAWRALLTGPAFPLRMHVHALRDGTPQTRRWIAIELLGNLLWIGLVFGILDIAALRYHVWAMLGGQCLAGFFCVWTVHHDCDGESVIARTIRRRLASILTFEMFYHLEHHLFPAVPTCNLPRLAERLDAAAPHAARARVF